MSYAPQILRISISFEDVQMILLPFFKISNILDLEKCLLALASSASDPWLNQPQGFLRVKE